MPAAVQKQEMFAMDDDYLTVCEQQTISYTTRCNTRSSNLYKKLNLCKKLVQRERVQVGLTITEQGVCIRSKTINDSWRQLNVDVFFSDWVTSKY